MTTWVKVYNSMPSNPKVTKVGVPGAWLFVCGLCYCNEHLTDGFIARHVLPIVAPGVKGAERLAGLLVIAGLWHEVEGGWQVHDYQEHQRSAEEVRTLRNWDVERKAFFRDRQLVASIRARDGDRCRYCNRTVNWMDRRGECGGTYDHVIPRGGNSYENVVVACKSCNSRKGARTPEQARMRLYDPPSPDPGPSSDPDPDPDPRASLDLPRVEGRRQKAEIEPATQAARRRATRRVDQSKLPDDFPGDLLAAVDAVQPILIRCWDLRGGVEPGRRGVGLAVLRNPRADHEQVARKLEHWLLAGKGQRARCADVASRFGDWVADEGSALRVIDGGTGKPNANDLIGKLEAAEEAS